MAKKKKYMVMSRTPNALEKGLETSKGNLSFKDKTALYVSDAGLAEEIEARHGKKGSGDVWVHEDERAERWEMNDRNEKILGGIHNYTFTGVEVPWRKKKWRPQDDPEWEEYTPGRWRRVSRKLLAEAEEAEVTDGKEEDQD